jgi:hypothetical protein
MHAAALTLFAASILAGSPLAQIVAKYTTYGTGCPGTGTGLGANHVCPASMANAFGGSNNSIPFTWSPVRYQQVFLASELPAPFTMYGLSLRQDERAASHGVTVDLDITVAYTTKTPQTISTTFPANFDSGTPIVVLPRAQVVFPDMPLPPTDPREFFLTIPWSVPFDWVPQPGRNLLIQVAVYGNSHGNQPWGYPLDANGGTARLYADGPNALTGKLEVGYGLVMGFRALTHTAVPRLYTNSTPQIGDTFRVQLNQARPATLALLALGFSKTSWLGIPLPLELTGFGAPGCRLLAAIDDTQRATTNATGYGSFQYSIPNDIYLLNIRFYNQWIVVDPGANAFQHAFTNGGEGLIGNM